GTRTIFPGLTRSAPVSGRRWYTPAHSARKHVRIEPARTAARPAAPPASSRTRRSRGPRATAPPTGLPRPFREFPSRSLLFSLEGLGDTTDLDRGLVDHVLVGLGVALLIIHVPAEALEEGVDEFLANLGLVVVGRQVGVGVAAEEIHQFEDFLRSAHRGWLGAARAAPEGGRFRVGTRARQVIQCREWWRFARRSSSKVGDGSRSVYSLRGDARPGDGVGQTPRPVAPAPRRGTNRTRACHTSAVSGEEAVSDHRSPLTSCAARFAAAL